MCKTAPTFGLVVNLPPSSMVQLRIYLYSFYDCTALPYSIIASRG
jgi:hypothetical protein